MSYILIQLGANWRLENCFMVCMDFGRGVGRGRLNIMGMMKSTGRVQIRRVEE